MSLLAGKKPLEKKRKLAHGVHDIILMQVWYECEPIVGVLQQRRWEKWNWNYLGLCKSSGQKMQWFHSSLIIMEIMILTGKMNDFRSFFLLSRKDPFTESCVAE